MPLSEIPIELFTDLPEYRNPSWLATVPRELVQAKECKSWELFHPIPISRVSGLENIATRLWANILALTANYDEDMASLILKHGSIPDDSEVRGLFGEKFYDTYRGVAFFAGYVNDENFFRACWTTTTNAVFIEEVGSKSNGKNGGWGLTKALLDKLTLFAREHERPIHVATVSPESESVFLHYGFLRFKARLSLKAHKFRSDLILHPRKV